jgi:hypothetical protein
MWDVLKTPFLKFLSAKTFSNNLKAGFHNSNSVAALTNSNLNETCLSFVVDLLKSICDGFFFGSTSRSDIS